ncbi:MAG: protein kinase [Archangium sp.]|nr:protein kinase [Archangium sp.]
MSDGARLESQGKLDEALKAFAGQRDWDGAVRVAMALNRHVEAANYCLEAARFWDAAVCFQRGGALQECLSALGKIPATNQRYRQAVVHAVRVAGLIDTPLDSLSTWLMPFIGHAPAAPVEAEAMKAIAESFAENGKDRLASSIFRTVLTAFPADDDAKERLAALLAKGPAATPAHGADSAGFNSTQSGAFASSPSSAARVSSGSGVRSSVSGLSRALRRRLGSLLVEKGLLNLSHLERLTREQPELAKNEAALAEAVVAAGLVKDEDVLKVLSEQAGIPYIVDAELMSSLSAEAVKSLPEEQARSWRVVPIKIADRALHVAMEDPRDVALVDRLRFATRLKIVPLFATGAGIRRATSKQYQGFDPEENAPAWHGQLFDPSGNSAMNFEPFSDRVTGTREHSFDTNEFALKEVQSQKRIPTRPPPASAQAPMPTVGSKLGERYQLEAVLGEGGSASVFRAMDLELNEHVAVKVFHPATEREAETLIARFKLELSLSRALSHPNITRLFDLGSAGPWRFLTMELLEGADLARKLEEARGPLPLREGLAWLEQACLGLQAAHERDVVHRDVKPQNIFVTTSGNVKLMDFGIARKRSVQGVTMSGMIGGTPEYMSPEQINNFSDVTYATDLYALGVTAYQLFTGVLPFDFPELTRVLVAQASETPAPPRSHNPAMPELLERLILNMLEKDPTKRPPSALWVGQQFRSLRLLSR